MAAKKRSAGLSQAEKRKKEREAQRKEKEREAAKRRREKLRREEEQRKRRAKEREKLKRERETLRRKLQRARKIAKEQERERAKLARRGAAIRSAVLKAADRRLQKAQQELALAQAMLLRTRQRAPTRGDQFRAEVVAAQQGEHPQLKRLRTTFDMYLDLKKSGEIKSVPHTTQTMDLESSRHGAIVEYRIPIGDKLDEATITEAVHQAQKAVAEISKWHKNVYANIHLFQSEPTYDTSSERGKRGASPDGWIKEASSEDEGDLWSVWQGVPTMEVGPQVADMIQAKLEGVVDANGKRTVSVLHEIIIRSMSDEELGRYKKRRQD